MQCSGADDGTRRCQCQKQYFYDQDRKRCRKSKKETFVVVTFTFSGGDYRAPCESTLDCQSNLICNKTAIPSFCSCEFHYQYHPSLRKCRGDPGAVCDRATAECVDNAECRDGACECAQQFIPDDNKVCGKRKTSLPPRLTKERSSLRVQSIRVQPTLRILHASVIRAIVDVLSIAK